MDASRDYTIGVAFLANVQEHRPRSRRCALSLLRLRDLMYQMMNDSREYKHAELFFERKDVPPEYWSLVEPPSAQQADRFPRSDFLVAIGAVEEKGVFALERVFKSTDYTTVKLKVTYKDLATAMAYAFSQVRARKPYNFAMAGWRIFWAPQFYKSGGSHWCASLVHATLRRAGFLRHQRINTLDIPHIKSLVERSHHCVILGGMRPMMFRQQLKVLTHGGTHQQIASGLEKLLRQGAVERVEDGSRYLMPARAGGSGAASSYPVVHRDE